MISNNSTDWGKIYDEYEIEFRNNYKTISYPQNYYLFMLLKKKYPSLLRKDWCLAEIGFGGGYF